MRSESRRSTRSYERRLSFEELEEQIHRLLASGFLTTSEDELDEQLQSALYPTDAPDCSVSVHLEWVEEGGIALPTANTLRLRAVQHLAKQFPELEVVRAISELTKALLEHWNETREYHLVECQ